LLLGIVEDPLDMLLKELHGLIQECGSYVQYAMHLVPHAWMQFYSLAVWLNLFLGTVQELLYNLIHQEIFGAIQLPMFISLLPKMLELLPILQVRQNKSVLLQLKVRGDHSTVIVWKGL
jgi:hypothetical protein